MVAITVVLAAVLYVMVTGLVGAPPAQRPSLVISTGSWNNGNITLSFVSITNAQALSPADLTYLIMSADGTTYFSGPEGTGSPFSSVALTVDYLDTANVGKVTLEDTVKITVSPATSTAVRAGSFTVYYSGSTIGFVSQLP
jgi:FlaG/FlaF family flagellin (archaellin)